MSLPARTAASARESVIRKSPGQNFKRWPRARVSLRSSFGGVRLRLFHLFPRKPVAIRDAGRRQVWIAASGMFKRYWEAERLSGHGCQGTVNVHPDTLNIKQLVCFRN